MRRQCPPGPVLPGQAKAQAAASAKARAAALAADLKITPSNGSHGVDPSAGISVTAPKGKVTSVTVHTSGDAVSGSLSDGGKTWHSSARQLDVSQSYTVTATGTDGSDHKITTTSTFRTLTPAQTFSTLIYEGYGQTYGVGMPIIADVQHADHQQGGRRAVTGAHHVQAGDRRLVHWDAGDEHLYFRPRDYWPANTTVSLDGHLNGVQGANGVYATANLTLTQTFDIGRSLIAVASTTTHRTQIYLNGKLGLPVADQHRPPPACRPRTAAT